MGKPHKYNGILREPAGSAFWEFCDQREALRERLDALFRDFGMVPDHRCIPFFQLLLKLAERHVPGFSREDRRRPGQPRKAIDIELIEQFENIMDKRKLSARSAAPYVAKDRRINGDKAVAALLKKYRDAKKKLEAHDAMVAKWSATLIKEQ